MRILRGTPVAIAFAIGPARRLTAQTGYYNLDSGRPTRVEDAMPTALQEIELQFLPLRVERLGDGTERLRFEPKIAYGILPRTEIEARMPLMDVRVPHSAEATGIASAALGALHAFNSETGSVPALAVAAEWVLPVGSLSAAVGSYSVKGLATKTLPFGRLHVNVGGGTWSARIPGASSSTAGTLCGNAPGVPPCLIPDVPCDLVPGALAPNGSTAFSCAPAAGAAIVASGAPRTTGPHWTAGLGVDRTLPMISTLLTADLVVDRFAGLYTRDDWTAEIGVRRQLTPELIADVGAGRRFAGTTQSTSVVFGISYSAPLRALVH
jgi:hypothetical protein